MLIELLFFTLTLVIIGAVTFLVYKEVKKVKKSIKVEDETSRYETEYLRASLSNNMKIVNHDMEVLKYNVDNAQEALTNNVNTSIAGLSNNYISMSNILSTVNKSVFSFLNKSYVVSDAVAIRPDGLVLFSDGNEYATMQYVDKDNTKAGLQIFSDPQYPDGFDLTTSNIATANLTVRNKLSFADAKSSYMLGIDGTSMFLQMPTTASSFDIKTSSNVTRASFNSTGNTSFYGDVSVSNCIGGIDGTSKLCFPQTGELMFETDQTMNISSNGIKIGNYTISEISDKLMIQHKEKPLIALDPTNPDPLLVYRTPPPTTTTQTTITPPVTLSTPPVTTTTITSQETIP